MFGLPHAGNKRSTAGQNAVGVAHTSAGAPLTLMSVFGWLWLDISLYCSLFYHKSERFSKNLISFYEPPDLALGCKAIMKG